MSDYEIIMIILTIITLLMAASRKNNGKSEPPRSCPCTAVQFAYSIAVGPFVPGTLPVYIVRYPRNLVNQGCGVFLSHQNSEMISVQMVSYSLVSSPRYLNTWHLSSGSCGGLLTGEALFSCAPIRSMAALLGMA